MGFGAIELTTITRSQEITTIKQNEDNKSAQAQMSGSSQVEKQTRQLTQAVNSSSESEWYQKKPDAKEKGGNEYAGDGGKGRKKKEKQEKQEKQERMVIKGHQGFDMKV